MRSQAQKITSFLCEEILEKMIQLIDLTQINKKFPSFVLNQCLSMTYCSIQASQCDHEKLNTTGMKQQKLSEVFLIQKDSLMPKGIGRQSQQIDKVLQMQEKISKNKKKNLNGTRTSFNRSNIHSVSNTNRNSKASQTLKIKKRNQSPFISLVQQEEDPESLAFVRKIKDSQWNSNQDQIKISEKKQIQFLQKKERFINQLAQKGFTFDFQGDAINSTIDQKKINYYTLKTRLSVLDKKIKTNTKFRQSANGTQLKVYPKKKVILKDLPSMSMQINQIIPVFQNQNVDSTSIFGLPNQKQKCNLKQFKKYYSGKFSRVDKSLNTIDISLTEKSDQYQQIFTQRRYLKDQQKNLNESMASYKTKLEHVTKRKLALPKIHGKYSTLDRYQQN